MQSTTTLFATIISTNPYCTHELFNNTIHHIIVKKICPETVDAYFQILDDIYSKSDSTETICILSEGNFGAISLSTLIAQVRPLLNRHPRPPATRHAVVVGDTAYQTPIIDVLKRTMPIPRHKMRYYRQDEELQAIDWLLYDN